MGHLLLTGDGEKSRFGGKGVRKAVSHINGEIASSISNKELDQRGLDRTMIDLDGTANKGRLGANALLGVSMAAVRAEAASKRIPLYRHLGSLYANDRFTGGLYILRYTGSVPMD